MQLPTIEDVTAARDALRGIAIRTPLVRLNGRSSGPAIWLKLENLQPTGSFKLRGAAAVLAGAAQGDVAAGIVTASAGNMGLGAAWFARRLGVRCTVLVPPTAPPSKIAAMENFGAT
ncbi:MAG TPA: pyridoxal-phosphate dependent enzyme, partial [Micromonosporaceae bacterium]